MLGIKNQRLRQLKSFFNAVGSFLTWWPRSKFAASRFRVADHIQMNFILGDGEEN